MFGPMQSHERHLHLVDPFGYEYARSQLDLFDELESDGRLDRIEVRVEQTSFVTAGKGVLIGTERAAVIVGFGDRVEDAHYLALSVPDAHELVHRVQRALEVSLPI